jgi:glycosyltransferase involved in cell wall biosynthesis
MGSDRGLSGERSESVRTAEPTPASAVVTFVNKYYYPHLGGIEYHLRDLGSALARVPGMHVRAIVANEGPDTVTDDVEGVEVTRLGRAFAYASTPVALGMARAISAEATRSEPADLVHLHFPYPWGETAWQVAHPPLPSVLTYHSDIVRQKALLAAYDPLLRRLLRRVDVVIASSPDMVEHSPYLSEVAEKCRVVPFGIHVEHYAATPEVRARAEQLRAGHDRPIVLFVGRLIYYKGPEFLVRAMAEVDADLVVIGKGPLQPALEALSAELGIADRVTFLPPQPDDELVAWYHAADVFCLPSIARSEAFGLVQLEAHASGLPVVSTRLTTGVPYVNLDGVTGLTVPPGDVEALARALQTLVSDDGLRRRLGEQARERALRDFTTERMVRDTVSIYSGLLR